MFTDRKTYYYKNIDSFQMIPRFSVMPIKIQADLGCVCVWQREKDEQDDSRMYVKMQRAKYSENTVEAEQSGKVLAFPNINALFKDRAM